MPPFNSTDRPARQTHTHTETGYRKLRGTIDGAQIALAAHKEMNRKIDV